MKHKVLIASLLLGSALLATAAKDPVLMKINGKEIKLSEFEYLYRKNSQQQLEPETLDQYVDRFVTYKLKVADAAAAGIDTMPAFQKELNGYKTDIIKPFLEDTTVTERLIKEAYEHKLTNVDIDHFMYPIGDNFSQNRRHQAFVDSIYQCFLNGEDWGELARKYSTDPSVKTNDGHYGYIYAGVFPWDFEKVVWDTPVGQVSKPFRTDFGYHIIRVNAIRPDDGEVHTQHILKLFPRVRTLTDEMKAEVKHRIDSVYQLLLQGADFSQLAIETSDDQGSAKSGGDLPWFGHGRMVQEFDSVAFSLKDGEISTPFATRYGYHVMKRLGHRMPTLEDTRGDIVKRINADQRKDAPRQERIAQLKQQYNYKENPDLHKYLISELTKHGQYDSTFVVDVIARSNVPIFTFAKQSVPVSELARHLSKKQRMAIEDGAAYIESFVKNKGRDKVMDYYADNIIDDSPEFANLLNEYRDGMMLFEISNRRVWEAAGKDTLGLNRFYEANRTKYVWDSPRFKGIILKALNDSTLTAVKADLAALEGLPLDTITTRLHQQYGSNIKMERMLMARGENDVVDHMFFNGPAPGGKYQSYMVLTGGLIRQPEELNDVRGQVTSDYQDELEKRWIEELRARYPVEVNKKVLKKVKP